MKDVDAVNIKEKELETIGKSKDDIMKDLCQARMVSVVLVIVTWLAPSSLSLLKKCNKVIPKSRIRYQ